MDGQSRYVWTQIDPNIRSKIVKYLAPQNGPPLQNNNSFSKKGSGSTSVNLHDISLYYLLANFHVSVQPEPTKTDDTIATTDVKTTTTNNNETTIQYKDQLLIQAVKSSGSNIAKPQHSPADIRSVLSKNNTRNGNVH